MLKSGTYKMSTSINIKRNTNIDFIDTFNSEEFDKTLTQEAAERCLVI